MKVMHPSIQSFRRGHRSPAHAQRGVVLLVALVFLVLLTLLALSSSGSSLLQEKMVSAVRNQQLAQFGAESAARDAETRLWRAPITHDEFVRNCAGTGRVNLGCRMFQRTTSYTDFQDFKTKPNLDLASSSVQKYSQPMGSKDLTGLTGNDKLAVQPRYIVEYLGVVRPPGVGNQHESGATGSGGTAVGNQEVRLFRITARSDGGNTRSRKTVQTTFQALGHD